MLTELKPMLTGSGGRTLMLAFCRLPETKPFASPDEAVFQVTVIPKPGSDDDEKKLIGYVPFVATGTAEELDAELPKMLGEYAINFVGVQTNIEDARKEMKEAEADIKKAAEEKRKEASENR
jgi:PRTRC genetic system protein E